MKPQSMTLNIKYDAPKETWEKLLTIYSKLEGWLGNDDNLLSPSEWFSSDETQKHIHVSVEPGGLLFTGLMEDDAWEEWVGKIKQMATEELNYKVGEVETGEVDL